MEELHVGLPRKCEEVLVITIKPGSRSWSGGEVAITSHDARTISDALENGREHLGESQIPSGPTLSVKRPGRDQDDSALAQHVRMGDDNPMAIPFRDKVFGKVNDAVAFADAYPDAA